jgi:fatty acid-binding protein DegV
VHKTGARRLSAITAPERVAVAVCSDTTNYLPRELVARDSIHEISLYVSLDGHQQREAEILEDTDAFYDALRATQEAATTAQPAVGDFLSVWQPILDAGDDVVSIHIASGIEYLRRGGRIGGAQAWVGSALKIKPILTLDGEITPIERVRTSQRAFARMVGFIDELRVAGRDGWVVQHMQAPDEAQRLVDHGREVFGTDPVFVSEVGPVIGAHVGPGLLGVGAVPSSLLN